MAAECLSFRVGAIFQIYRIPKRLRHIVPGAKGANNTFCFTMGSGPFQDGELAAGLLLIPDPGRSPVTHGVIAPIQIVPLAQYQMDLANTRVALAD